MSWSNFCAAEAARIPLSAAEVAESLVDKAAYGRRARLARSEANYAADKRAHRARRGGWKATGRRKQWRVR